MRKLIVLALVLSGCVYTMGKPIPMERVQELKPGVSTLADAKAIFGEPRSASSMPPLGLCYSWVYASAQAYNPDATKSQTLTLCFDPTTGKYHPQQEPVKVEVVKPAAPASGS